MSETAGGGSEAGIRPLGEAIEQNEQAAPVVDVVLVSDATARGRSTASTELLPDYILQYHTLKCTHIMMMARKD